MWRRLVTAVALAVVLAGLAITTPAQAATYYWSRCGNTSGRVLLTLDDWAYGDPYRATRVGDYLKSRNIRAAFLLINQEAEYPDIIATLRQQGHWVLNHTYSHPRLTELSDADVTGRSKTVSLAIGCGRRSAHLTPGSIALRAALATGSVCGLSIAWTMSTSMAAAAAPPVSARSCETRHGLPSTTGYPWPSEHQFPRCHFRHHLRLEQPGFAVLPQQRPSRSKHAFPGKLHLTPMRQGASPPCLAVLFGECNRRRTHMVSSLDAVPALPLVRSTICVWPNLGPAPSAPRLGSPGEPGTHDHFEIRLRWGRGSCPRRCAERSTSAWLMMSQDPPNRTEGPIYPR